MLYKTYPGIVLTSVCGHYYLVTPQSSIELNDTAAFYWKCLGKWMEKKDLKEAAMEVYDVEDEKALEEEIGAFLDTLSEQKLLLKIKTPYNTETVV